MTRWPTHGVESRVLIRRVGYSFEACHLSEQHLSFFVQFSWFLIVDLGEEIHSACFPFQQRLASLLLLTIQLSDLLPSSFPGTAQTGISIYSKRGLDKLFIPSSGNCQDFWAMTLKLKKNYFLFFLSGKHPNNLEIHLLHTSLLIFLPFKTDHAAKNHPDFPFPGPDFCLSNLINV